MVVSNIFFCFFFPEHWWNGPIFWSAHFFVRWGGKKNTNWKSGRLFWGFSGSKEDGFCGVFFGTKMALVCSSDSSGVERWFFFLEKCLWGVRNLSERRISARGVLEKWWCLDIFETFSANRWHVSSKMLIQPLQVFNKNHQTQPILDTRSDDSDSVTSEMNLFAKVPGVFHRKWGKKGTRMPWFQWRHGAYWDLKILDESWAGLLWRWVEIGVAS